MNNQSGNLKEYFTKDILEQIYKLSNDEMNGALKELGNSYMWIAVLKYFQIRMEMAQTSLYTLDPFKQQTEMARCQGILMGLSDLQEMIASLLAKDNKKE